MRYLRFTLLPLLFVACERQPVGLEADPPLLSDTFSDVLLEVIDDFSDYVKCANDGAGEVLHWYGPFRVTGCAVTSNSPASAPDIGGV